MTHDVHVVFWGHACFGIHRGSKPLLLIDPFDPEGLGNIPGPPAIDVAYPYVIGTHDHSDHAAFHTQRSAQRVHAPCVIGADALEIEARTAAHDEFGGRLRGGTTDMLDLRIDGLRIVHCGDLGERLIGKALEWLRAATPDLLILPAGGYFTLGVDGATELASIIRPRYVAFCHTRDDGLPLPQLQPRARIERRVAAWPQRHLATLPLSKAKANANMNASQKAALPTVVWFERPDGRALNR